MSHYYNAAGQRFDLPERPLEPPDCLIGAALLLTEGAAEQWEDKKTAPSADGTESGRAEKVLEGSDSASNDTEN